jgi:hypothetical protein
MDAIFKKFCMKADKLKINLILSTLNFVSIQLNYLQASPISWDYPFKSCEFMKKFKHILDHWSGV